MTISKAPTLARENRTPVSKTSPRKTTVVGSDVKKNGSAAGPGSVTASVPASAGKHKTKVVRDSFTIPKPEYAVLDELKLRATKLATPTKKSELIRAGIKALAGLSDKAFLAAIGQVPNLKTGRPPKSADAKPAK
jgi:hypothetical protein